MKKRYKRHSKEFKKKAIEYVMFSDQKITDIYRRFDISTGGMTDFKLEIPLLLKKWLAEAIRLSLGDLS